MYRIGISALICNDHDEFLLVNLESFEEKYFSIPGGGIEPQESREDAVYREISEELGIPRKSLKLVGSSDVPVRFQFKKIVLARNGIEYKGQERYFFGFRFIGADTEITPGLGEVRKYEWVSLANLRNYLHFENQLQETLDKIAEIFPDLAVEAKKDKNVPTN